MFYNTESIKHVNIGYANVEETAVLSKMCCSIFLYAWKNTIRF